MMRCASPVLLDELRNFDFGAFPPHVRDLKCYAWKPLLLEALHREFPNEVCSSLSCPWQRVLPFCPAQYCTFK